MTKLLPFSAKLPENLHIRIAEIAQLLGYSQNQVAVEVLDVGLNVIYNPDCSGFSRIVTIARAVLLEARMQRASGIKIPLGERVPVTTFAPLPPALEARIQRVSLNGSQMRALRHLVVSKCITRREYEALTNTPPATAKRQLAGLVQIGVLVRRGKSRNSWYELVDGENCPVQRKSEPQMTRNGPKRAATIKKRAASEPKS